MKGVAVLVMRYTHPDDREYRVPLNLKFGKRNSAGPGADHPDPVLDRRREPVHETERHRRGHDFFGVLFGVFTVSETHRAQRSRRHVEMDKFNVAARRNCPRKASACGPATFWFRSAIITRCTTCRRCSIASTPNARHRGAARPAAAPVRLRRSELEAEQLFGSVEQYLFTKALSLAEKRGKTVRLAVVSANDMWDGILNAADNLESTTIVLGRSTKWTVPEQAREIGLAWEALPDPRPQFNLEIFPPGGSANFSCWGRTRRTSPPTKCAWFTTSGCASAIWSCRTNCIITTWCTLP